MVAGENEAMVAGGGVLNMLLWVNGGNLAKMGNQNYWWELTRALQGKQMLNPESKEMKKAKWSLEAKGIWNMMDDLEPRKSLAEERGQGTGWICVSWKTHFRWFPGTFSGQHGNLRISEHKQLSFIFNSPINNWGQKFKEKKMLLEGMIP